MTDIYRFHVLIALLSVLSVHAYINSDANIEQATIERVKRLTDLALCNTQSSRDSVTQIIASHEFELVNLIQNIGVTGNVEEILDASSRMFSEKWQNIKDTRESNAALADQVVRQEINEWFASLSPVTQRNPLAQYYLRQLLNSANDFAEMVAQHSSIDEIQSADDLQNIGEYVRYLNALALEDCDNADEYQRLLETLYKNACPLQRLSSDNYFNSIEFFISDGAYRYSSLILATEAI